MKISVRVKGEWFAVPVTDAKCQTVKWLAEEALKKLSKLCQNKGESSAGSKVENETFYEIRKAKGGAILDPEDLIQFVLDDNDFVSLGKLA